MKKILVALVMVLLIASLGFAGGRRQAAAGEERYAILLKTFANEFWTAMADGIQQYARENGILVDLYAAQSEADLQGQLAMLEDIARKDYVGIGVAPLSPVNLINGIVQANKKGIPVINIDERVDFDQLRAAGGHMIGNYTTDNVAVGRQGGTFIAQRIGNGSKAAIIQGMAGNETSNQRSRGAEEAMKAAGINIVSIQPGDWDRVKALDVATNVMQANPDIRAFYCANDTMALGVLQAVQNAGRTSQVIVVGTDAVPGAVESVNAGGLAATVGQDPAGIGVACLKDLVLAHRNGFTFNPNAEIPIRYIDSFLVTK